MDIFTSGPPQHLFIVDGQRSRVRAERRCAQLQAELKKEKSNAGKGRPFSDLDMPI